MVPFDDAIEYSSYQLPVYLMNIQLRDFNAKVGGENILQPIIGKESVKTESNDNAIRSVNFAISKNLIVKNTIF